MKNTKKIIAFTLVIVIIFSMSPVVFASESGGITNPWGLRFPSVKSAFLEGGDISGDLYLNNIDTQAFVDYLDKKLSIPSLMDFFKTIIKGGTELDLIILVYKFIGGTIWKNASNQIKEANKNETGIIITFYGKAGVDPTVRPQTSIPTSTPKETVQITISVSPSEGGTLSGGGAIIKGTSTQINATAKSGYTFDGWYENNMKVSDKAAWRFNADRNITLQARFIKQGQSTSSSTTSTSIRVTTDNVSSITTTNAYLHGSINGVSKGDTVNCGFYFGTSQNNMTKVVTFPAGKNASYGVGCDINTEAKMTLTAGTTYYYQAYATGKDGKTYTGDIKSFTTTPVTISTSPITITVNQPSNITNTSVTLNFSLSSKDKIQGFDRLYIGTSSNNLTMDSSSVGEFGTNPNISREVKNLSPSTTYYYYYDITVGQETYTSEVKSFKTADPVKSEPSYTITKDGTVTYITIPKGKSVEFSTTSKTNVSLSWINDNTNSWYEQVAYYENGKQKQVILETFGGLYLVPGERTIVSANKGDVVFYIGSELASLITMKEYTKELITYFTVPKGKSIEFTTTSKDNFSLSWINDNINNWYEQITYYENGMQKQVILETFGGLYLVPGERNIVSANKGDVVFYIGTELKDLVIMKEYTKELITYFTIPKGKSMEFTTTSKNNFSLYSIDGNRYDMIVYNNDGSQAQIVFDTFSGLYLVSNQRRIVTAKYDNDVVFYIGAELKDLVIMKEYK